MKTDKQFIDEIYKKYDEYQKEEKIKRQKVMKRIINIAAVFVVALSSVVVFSQKKTPKVLQEMKKEDVAKIDLETVGNFENFYNIIKSKNSTNGETKYSFNLQESITDVAKSDMLETRSNTNIQVENVDEGDIVKTDDKYIYYLSKQRLIIINAENAETSGKIAEINFKEENFYPIEIYVQNNKLALIGNIAYNENLKMSTEMQDISEVPKSKTGIIIYDITDRSNPKEIRNVMIEGSYITSMSRMIDENIYFAVSENIYGYDISCKSIEELNENDYMPKYTDTAISNEEKCISYDKIYNLDETEDANYLILVGININGDNEADIQTFLGAGTYLYSSEKNMYIATNEVEYDENYKVINTKTKLMKFELNNGNTGSNGGNVILIMTQQNAEGNIVIDSISTLDMTMSENSYYEGTINGSNEAKSITLKLDSTSKIKLTGDSYITSLEADDTTYSNIDFNGYKLYVNGVAIN